MTLCNEDINLGIDVNTNDNTIDSVGNSLVMTEELIQEVHNPSTETLVSSFTELSCTYVSSFEFPSSLANTSILSNKDDPSSDFVDISEETQTSLPDVKIQHTTNDSIQEGSSVPNETRNPNEKQNHMKVRLCPKKDDPSNSIRFVGINTTGSCHLCKCKKFVRYGDDEMCRNCGHHYSHHW